MTPCGYVMSGTQLVATVLRSGGGRRPRAWCLYYSPWAEAQGARSGALFTSRHAAVLAARQWCARLRLPVRYERVTGQPQRQRMTPLPAIGGVPAPAPALTGLVHPVAPAAGVAAPAHGP